MSRRFVVAAVITALACRGAQEQRSSHVPTIRATVISVRTSIQPENRLFTSEIIIAGRHARDTRESDTWRLYDLDARTVTFVDDIARTFRTESMEALVRQRRIALQGPAPVHVARPTLTRGHTHRVLQGADAELWVIQSGTYRRELWMAQHRTIPSGLFAMMHASDPITTPLAPIMRDVDEALIATEAYPLIDRSEIPIGTPPMIVERTVSGIERKNVPESLVRIPSGYRELGKRN